MVIKGHFLADKKAESINIRHFTQVFRLQNILREFTTREHKFKGDFVLKTSFKRSFERFLIFKNLFHIIYYHILLFPL